VVNESEQLTVREVSEMLHISPATVYKLISEGRIPTFRIGTEWGFQRDQIVHWIAEQTMKRFSVSRAANARASIVGADAEFLRPFSLT
jgi:excisionase family DNA binding protein